jgi:hypothetical protein
MNVILPIVIQFSLLLLNGIQINFCSAEWHFAECRVAILRHLKQAKNVSLGRSTSFGRKAFDRQTFGRHRQFRKYTCRPNWRNGGIKHRVGQMSVDQMSVDQIVFDEKTWSRFFIATSLQNRQILILRKLFCFSIKFWFIFWFIFKKTVP